MKRFLRLSSAFVVFVISSVSGGEKKTPDQIIIRADAAIALVESDYKMNPEKALSPRILRQYLAHRAGGPQEITAAELQALREGQPKKRPYLHNLPVQTGPPPPDTFSWEQVKLRFQAEEQLNRASGKDKPTASDYEKRLRMQVAPGATWFKAEQIAKAEKWEWFNPPAAEHTAEATQEEATYRALDLAYDKVQTAQENQQQGLRSPRIRRTWRDVLYDEDQSLGEGNTKKALSDLEGALFSYTHDQNADTDTWSSKAAIIFPYTRRLPTDLNNPGSFTLRQFALAPSVTIDRVDTNGDPTKETDSVLYRFGGYFDFYGIAQSDQPDQDIFGYGLQLRAAGVYATNTGHDAGLTGFETDFEPRFHYGNPALGYKINLWEKTPVRADYKDNTYLEGQLRLWLHTEGGHVQDAAASWVKTNDTFFRLGPTAQLSLTAPALPGQRSLSLTMLYSYFGAVSGPTDHSSYFRVTLSLDLLRNIELNHRVGITTSYERGGLNFTKQDVDTYTLGLSVLF
jgi:hypothetical protein